MAVVFITSVQDGEKKNEGLCLVCAKELGVPQIKEYMEQMGITDDNVEDFSEQMTQFSNVISNFDGDSFEPGGSGTIPSFIQSLLNDTTGGKDFLKDDKEKKKPPVEDIDEEKQQRRSGGKKHKFLDSFCTNLNKRVSDGKLDNIIGRDKEISRVIQILSRRTKNNPCLIGEPGVGKTAIAEGIAQKIVGGEVPFHIADKVVYLLDLTALVAGTQFRGQFESRVKGLVDEVKAEGNVILFIDEVHNLVGTGDSEGSMNAANILKPALSRGEIQVIGATTFKEYRKYIEKDSALERRFQPVTINEPNIDDTIEVLTGIRRYYEEHHKVKVSDAILRQCAILSERYINDRFLPDKAIDLLDEACAATSIRSGELAELDKLSKEYEVQKAETEALEKKLQPDMERMRELNTEIGLLEKDTNEIQQRIDALNITPEKTEAIHEYKKLKLLYNSQIRTKKSIEDDFEPNYEHLAKVKMEIIRLQDKMQEILAKTGVSEEDMQLMDSLGEMRMELEDKNYVVKTLQTEKEAEFAKAAEMRSTLTEMEKHKAALEKDVDAVSVTEDDLSKVIELWTGIPANKIVETEYSKMAQLSENLKKKIIGQDEAVELVAKSIKRTRVQLAKRRRPASFIFVGPTGVGKTELVKVLASELFSDTEPLIRLDMSEFMEKHAVSRLIGSPPGYVGYDEAGQLTEKVRRKPYSVVLFDEIEKAHPDVMNILLQILDEGKVNDAQGRSVSFENTVIAMTSNAGSTDKSTGVGFNKSEGDISKEKALKALSEFLRPEFLSRIDETVVFAPLSLESYCKIAGLMLEEMREPLMEKNIKLEYSQEALKAIADKSYGGKFGARDIRKTIRKDVEDVIATLIVERSGGGISKILIFAMDGNVNVKAE